MGKFDKDKDEKNTTNQSGKVNFPQANAARNALGQNSTTQTGVGGGKFNTDSDRQQRIYNAMKDAARIQAGNMETAYNSLLGSMQNTGWKSAEDMDTIGTSLENVENLLNMRRFSSGQNEDLTALESSLKNIRSQYESDRKVYGQFTSAEEYDGFLEQLRQMRQLETTYGQRYWDTFGSGDYTEGQLLQKGGNQWAAFGSWANQQEALSQAQNARNDEARYLEELEAIKDSIAKRYGFSGGSDVTNDETISYAREAVETYPEDSEVYKEAKAFLDAWEGAGTARETALAKDEEARLAGDDAQMYRDLEQIWALPEDVQQGIRVVYADTNAAKNENDPINLGMENTVAAQYRELLEREYDITPQRAVELGETQQRYENMVRSNEQREQWQQWAKDQPVWNYLGGLGANFAGVVTDTLGTMRNLGRNYYSTADPYDPLYAFSQYGETVHSTIGEGIDNDILKVIYSGATSALDNGLRIGAGLLTGHPGMSLGLAGVGSFNDTFRDASQRGATREQALLLGTTAAALEVGTEKISLDRLLKPGNVASVTDVVREVLMQGGVEVSEEELSLLGNALADSVIMGSNSDLELRANEYAKANGVSVDRAMGKLLLGDIMETAATTLISAGLMSGTRSIAELYTNQETGRRVLREGNLETYLTAAEALGEDSKAAEYLNKKGISPKSTAGQVGTFAGLVNQEGQRLLDQITTGTNQEEVTKAYLTAAEVLENNSDASVVARNLFHAKALELGFDPTEATSAYQTRSAQRKAGYIESVINSGDTSRGTIHRAAAAIRRDQGYQDQYEKQTGVQWTGTRAVDRLNGKARADKKNLKSVIEKRKESSATKPDDAGEYVTATTNGRVRTKDGSIEPMFGIDIRDNEIYALLPAGKEQKLDDVTVGGTLGDLINYAQERFKNGTYDADAVRTMVMGYTDNNDPGELEQYVQAFKEVYTAGRLNPDVAEDEVAAYIEELREGGEGPLQDQAPEGMFPDHVRIETFKAGQRAAKRETEQGATETKKARHKGTGKVANERTGKGSTDQGKFQAFVTALAKNRLSHVDIKLVDKIAAGEGEANGAFAADILTIYLSGSADHELQALIHEMGELGKAYNREEYRSVRQELLTFWAEKQGFNEVESLIGQYMMRYGAAGNVTVDEVLDEIFNDAMGAILGSEGQLQSLVDWASTGPEQTQEQRQGVLKKLAKAIRKVIQGIRSLLKRWELNPGTEQFLELEAKQMDQLRQQFLRMIDEANRRAGEATLETEETESQEQTAGALENAKAQKDGQTDPIFSLTVEPVSEEQAAMQEAERIARLPAQRQREQLQADLETAQRQIDQLEREVKAMKNRGDYFKGQLRQSEGYKANTDRVRKYARELLHSYESGMNATDAAIRLKAMYDDFYGNFSDLGYNRLEQKARELAEDLIGQARVRKDSLYEDYKELRDTLRGITLTVTPEVVANVQNFATRRRMNTGRVRIKMAEWTNVDSVYHDVLTAQWSEFFREEDTMNPADQLDRIFDVAERIYSRELVNPYAGNLEQAIQDATDSIVAGFYTIGQEAPTFADKQASRLEATRNTYRQLLDQMEERLTQLQKKLRQTTDTDEKLKARMQRRLQQQERELQRTKDSFEQYRIARKEREGVEKYARQVRERAAKLEQMVYRPTKEVHMPDALRRPIADLLETLPALYEDRLEASSTRGEYMPGRKYAAALEKLLQTIGKPEGLDQDSGLVEIDGMMIDLPGEVREMIQAQYRTINEATKNWDTFEGKTWNVQTLRQLSNILRALTTSISKLNDLHVKGLFSSVDGAARATMRYMEDLGSAKGSAAKGAGGNENKTGLTDRMVWDNLVGYYAFKRYGDAGEAMFAGLRQGQSELAMLAQEIQRFAEETFTADEAKKWEKEKHTFALKSGEQLTLTAVQMMELHLLRQREQGLRHITTGGVKAGRVDPYHLSVDDMIVISGELSDRQKDVAAKLQKFVNTVGTGWGNTVSMARFGYKAFTEKNYWTIKTDDQSRSETQQELARAGETSVYKLLNMSFTKSLNAKANNAVILGNVFETFAGHMVDMAKYKALALPVLDVIRWYGYRERSGEYEWAGTRQSIEKALGKNAMEYVRQLLVDLSGQGGGHDVALQKIAGKMISNYKVAAVGANLRVALLQPTALTRAMLIIPPKYFTKNIIGGRVNDVEIWKMDGDQLRQEIRRMGAIKEMQHYSGIAVWKKLGYYDPSFGRSLTDVILGREGLFGTMQDLSMTPAEVGDLLTWGRIWKACKAMIRETQGLSGETLLQETAKKFDEVVYATQVVDTPLTRSANMRSKGDITKAFTAFMAEPTLGMNVLMDAAHRIRLDSRRMGKGKAWQRNWQYGVKALAVWCGTKVFSALMASIMDAARDDDDYEKYWEKWLQAFAGEKTPLDGNLLQELLPWNDLPFIGDIAAGIGEIFGVDTTNFARMETAVIPDIVNVIQIWKETYELQMGIVENPTDVTYNNKMTLYGKLYKTMQAASRLTGLPVANITRDAVALYNTFVGGPNDMRVQTYDLGTEGAIKNALGAGTLTEHDALYHLVEDAGLTSDEAFWKVREWTSGSKLSALQEAIQSGDDGRIQAALEEMYTYGYTKSQAENAARNVIKNLYLDKKNPISKEQATELLAAYGNRSEEKELYDLFSQWDYVREHGDTDGYNMYADVDDAVAQGEDIQEAMDQLKEHGYKTTTIESHIKAYIGEQYRNGQMDRKAAEARLTQYLGGMSEAETYELFAKWDYMGPEGSGEDFSVYTGLSNALVLGNGDQIQSEIDYLKEHGYTMDQIVSATTSAIGEAFINDYIDEKTATELLQTWTRSQNQDEIFKLMEKWNYAREHEGGTTGWSLYQELDEAVENGLSIKDACAALQAGGIDTDTITNHIQDTVEDAYLNGNISKTEARDRLTRYVGMDEDGLYWEMKELDWKKANPYGEYRGEYQDLYNAIDGGKSIQAATEELLAHGETEKTVNGAVKGYITDLYKDGTISEDRAREYLQRYLGLADTPKQNATVDDYALYWAMHELNYKKTHSGSYGKYYQVYEAIDNGTALSSIYTGLLNHGAQKGNIKSGIQGHYKDDLIELYYSGSSEDRERYALLRGRIASAVEALGYSRYDMLRTIDGWIAEAK